MKIAASTLQAQAQHSATRTHTQSERLELRVGNTTLSSTSSRSSTQASLGAATLVQMRAQDTPPAGVTVAPSLRAAAQRGAQQAPASATERSAGADDYENLTPHLSMVRDLIARMTGVQAQSVRLSVSQTSGAVSMAANTDANTRLALRYEQHEVLEETESTQYTTEGVVRTADGQEIRFSLQLSMQRSYREESHLLLRMGSDAQAIDPLVINFDGTAAELQSVRFAFDLNGDGQTEQVPLLSGNRGYLALDRNSNQRIDSGLELFGPATGNGYTELARHDDDGNGWIDENDAVFSQLKVWVPEAEGAGRLMSLKEAGVGALSLAATQTPFALRTSGNDPLGMVRSTSAYLREDGGAGTMQQIDLAV